MIEQVSTVVCDIPRAPQSAETVRVSIVTRAGRRFIDFRVYLADHPTEHGVSLREDLVPDVIAGLRDALDALERATDPAVAPLADRPSRDRTPELSGMSR